MDHFQIFCEFPVWDFSKFFRVLVLFFKLFREDLIWRFFLNPQNLIPLSNRNEVLDNELRVEIEIQEGLLYSLDRDVDIFQVLTNLNEKNETWLRNQGDNIEKQRWLAIQSILIADQF